MPNARKKSYGMNRIKMKSGNPSARRKGFDRDLTRDRRSVSKVSIFEGELGDAGFVEIAEAFDYHAVVLFLCGSRERRIETELAREFESDPAVFCGVHCRI